MEYRGYMSYNVMFYMPLLRSWLMAAHDVFVTQAQPLNPLFLISLDSTLSFFSGNPLSEIMLLLDASLCGQLDDARRVSHNSGVEMERRVMLERWGVMEQRPFPLDEVSLASHRTVELLRECHRSTRMFAKAGWSVWSSAARDDSASLRTRVDQISAHACALLRISTTDLARLIQVDADSDVARSKESSQSQQRVLHEDWHSSMKPLTDEQRMFLKNGSLRTGRTRVQYLGDPWGKPISSHESATLLWLLYHISWLLGFTDPKQRKTYFNIRPLGRKFFIYLIVLLGIAIWMFRYLGKIDFGSIFEVDQEDDI